MAVTYPQGTSEGLYGTWIDTFGNLHSSPRCPELGSSERQEALAASDMLTQSFCSSCGPAFGVTFEFSALRERLDGLYWTAESYMVNRQPEWSVLAHITALDAELKAIAAREPFIVGIAVQETLATLRSKAEEIWQSFHKLEPELWTLERLAAGLIHPLVNLDERLQHPSLAALVLDLHSVWAGHRAIGGELRESSEVAMEATRIGPRSQLQELLDKSAGVWAADAAALAQASKESSPTIAVISLPEPGSARVDLGVDWVLARWQANWALGAVMLSAPAVAVEWVKRRLEAVGLDGRVTVIGTSDELEQLDELLLSWQSSGTPVRTLINQLRRRVA